MILHGGGEPARVDSAMLVKVDFLETIIFEEGLRPQRLLGSKYTRQRRRDQEQATLAQHSAYLFKHVNKETKEKKLGSLKIGSLKMA